MSNFKHFVGKSVRVTFVKSVREPFVGSIEFNYIVGDSFEGLLETSTESESILRVHGELDSRRFPSDAIKMSVIVPPVSHKSSIRQLVTLVGDIEERLASIRKIAERVHCDNCNDEKEKAFDDNLKVMADMVYELTGELFLAEGHFKKSVGLIGRLVARS